MLFPKLAVLAVTITVDKPAQTVFFRHSFIFELGTNYEFNDRLRQS